jgi:hypothetical protein
VRVRESEGARARASESESERARARERECESKRYPEDSVYSVKRDLLQCQKRATVVSKETYYKSYPKV